MEKFSVPNPQAYEHGSRDSIVTNARADIDQAKAELIDPRRDVPDHQIHPAAELFPLMADEELRTLADDIKTNGLRYPILLDREQRVVDGRNRLAACKLVGVKPAFEETDGDPFDLVVTLNAMRRDLTKQQRAVIAAMAWNQFAAHLGREGRRQGRTADDLAEAFGVGRRYVQQAARWSRRRPRWRRPCETEPKPNVARMRGPKGGEIDEAKGGHWRMEAHASLARQ